ncbi:MAG: hypothetical protein ABS935_18790 [Solibacillus sp.]|uniref:hypothetical protein n=1 Tax=Solibacillus sp. TaxID=1909654 RepID=UPI00331475EA
MQKWKQTSVALLIAGLAVTGTSYALADEKENQAIEVTQHEKELTTDLVKEPTETVQLPVDEKVETDKVVEEKATEEKVTEDNAAENKEVKEKVLPEVPEGYTAGNLNALGKAYEKVQNPTAKAAIERNMERSIEKWENKQSKTNEQPKVEVPEQPETEISEQNEVKQETVKQEVPSKQEQPAKVKQEKVEKTEKAPASQARLNSQQREQRQELKLTQKAEREALKEERKTNKE